MVVDFSQNPKHRIDRQERECLLAALIDEVKQRGTGLGDTPGAVTDDQVPSVQELDSHFVVRIECGESAPDRLGCKARALAVRQLGELLLRQSGG